MNKFIITLIVILGGVLVFFGGYITHDRIGELQNTRSAALIDQPLDTNSLVQRFQESKTQKPTGIFLVHNQPFLFPTTTAQEDHIIGYSPSDTAIKSISINNQEDMTTLALIKPDVQSITWAANGKRFLAHYEKETVFYDLNANTSTHYPVSIINPVLDKTGDKVAYIYFNSKDNESYIAIADSKLNNFKTILPTRAQNWEITWLSDTVLCLKNQKSYNRTSLFLLDTTTQELQNIIDDQFISSFLWSPDGMRLVYSYYPPNTQNLTLALFDRTHMTAHTMTLSTHASACGWSIDSQHLDCIVHQDDPTTTQKKLSVLTLDTTYPTQPPAIVYQAPDQNSFLIQHVFLSTTEQYILFNNTFTNQLYGLALNSASH